VAVSARSRARSAIIGRLRAASVSPLPGCTDLFEIDVFLELLAWIVLRRERSISSGARSQKRSHRHKRCSPGMASRWRPLSEKTRVALNSRWRSAAPFRSQALRRDGHNRSARIYGNQQRHLPLHLTRMEEEVSSPRRLLREAQRLVYAEADPSSTSRVTTRRQKHCALGEPRFGTQGRQSAVERRGIAASRPKTSSGLDSWLSREALAARSDAPGNRAAGGIDHGAEETPIAQ